MEQKKPFLYDLFIPKQESNTFTFDRYIKEIEDKKKQYKTIAKKKPRQKLKK